MRPFGRSKVAASAEESIIFSPPHPIENKQRPRFHCPPLPAMKTQDLIQALAFFTAMLPSAYAVGGAVEFGVFRALKPAMMAGAKVKSPPKVHGDEE